MQVFAISRAGYLEAGRLIKNKKVSCVEVKEKYVHTTFCFVLILGSCAEDCHFV